MVNGMTLVSVGCTAANQDVRRKIIDKIDQLELATSQTRLPPEARATEQHNDRAQLSLIIRPHDQLQCLLPILRSCLSLRRPVTYMFEALD